MSGTNIWASNFLEHLPDLVNLNHLDLRGFRLERAPLNGKNMAGCCFRDCNLIGALCYGTDFSYSCFENADLSGALISGANLSNANLSRAKLLNALCDGTDFSCSRFGKADLSGALISNAILRGADLSQANLSHVHWDSITDMNGTEIKAPKATLIDRNTRFLPLSWDSLRHDPSDEEIKNQSGRWNGWTPHQFEVVRNNVGPLQRIALSRLEKSLRKRSAASIILPQNRPLASAADFAPEVILGDINTEELNTALTYLKIDAESAHLPLIKGDHDNADLTDRTLYPLRGGFIERASLVNASMIDQNLRGTVISNSNLSGINLRGADLTDAILVNVDLTGADLRGINLTRTSFVNCNLDRVRLDRVTMIATQMQQCTMANVTIREGVIEDLFVCQSDLRNISFAGASEGRGLIIRGIGLVDSIMINAQFSGNTSVGQIELSGSLGVGSGPGILDSANVFVSRLSYWRDEMIQRVPDKIFGGYFIRNKRRAD